MLSNEQQQNDSRPLSIIERILCFFASLVVSGFIVLITLAMGFADSKPVNDIEVLNSVITVKYIAVSASIFCTITLGIFVFFKGKVTRSASRLATVLILLWAISFLMLLIQIGVTLAVEAKETRESEARSAIEDEESKNFSFEKTKIEAYAPTELPDMITSTESARYRKSDKEISLWLKRGDRHSISITSYDENTPKRKMKDCLPTQIDSNGFDSLGKTKTGENIVRKTWETSRFHTKTVYSKHKKTCITIQVGYYDKRAFDQVTDTELVSMYNSLERIN